MPMAVDDNTKTYPFDADGVAHVKLSQPGNYLLRIGMTEPDTEGLRKPFGPFPVLVGAFR